MERRQPLRDHAVVGEGYWARPSTFTSRGQQPRQQPCTTTSQQGGSPRTWQRRPRAKQGQPSPWGYVWSKAPRKGWAHRPLEVLGSPGSGAAKQPTARACHRSGRQRSSWVPDPGCLAQRAHRAGPIFEDLRVVGPSSWLFEPILASRTAAHRKFSNS